MLQTGFIFNNKFSRWEHVDGCARHPVQITVTLARNRHFTPQGMHPRTPEIIDTPMVVCRWGNIPRQPTAKFNQKSCAVNFSPKKGEQTHRLWTIWHTRRELTSHLPHGR